MAKYQHHKYTWTNRFSVQHQWSFVGVLGGVHFTAHINKEYGDSCGLEFHHNRACHLRADDAPDHTECWLTGEPCWHDGTSLYATDELWPVIKSYLKSGEHEMIFKLLEGEADRRFDDFALANRLRARHPEAPPSPAPQDEG